MSCRPMGGGWLSRLMNGVASNICVMPVEGGAFTPVTNLGDRPTIIARQVSWSPDGASIYAAVAEISADIILLDGLI